MRRYLLGFLLLFSIPIFSQINESDTLKLQVRTAITGNYQTGNVGVFNLRSRLEFSVEPISNVIFKTQNNSLYQEFKGIKSDNDVYSRNYLYYKPKNTVYPFLIAYVSTNYRRKVDFRYFTGGGVTYQVIHQKEHVLKLATSLVYEESQFSTSIFNDAKYNDSKNIRLWRATTFIAGWHYLFHHKMRLYYDAFYQPAFGNTQNFRTQCDVSLDVPIYRGLAFNTVYTYTKENVVALNTKQNDAILTFGLSYNFKKNSSFRNQK